MRKCEGVEKKNDGEKSRTEMRQIIDEKTDVIQITQTCFYRLNGEKMWQEGTREIPMVPKFIND
jgi:hypothetical protein